MNASRGTGGALASLLEAADARLLLLETANARRLQLRQRRTQERRTAWEALMAATNDMETVIAREEADVAAMEQRDAEVHAHIQELRGLIVDLRATATAGEVLQASQVQRLSAVADRIEAATAGEAADTTEPAPESTPTP